MPGAWPKTSKTPSNGLKLRYQASAITWPRSSRAISRKGSVSCILARISLGSVNRSSKMRPISLWAATTASHILILIYCSFWVDGSRSAFLVGRNSYSPVGLVDSVERQLFWGRVKGLVFSGFRSPVRVLPRLASGERAAAGPIVGWPLSLLAQAQSASGARWRRSQKACVSSPSQWLLGRVAHLRDGAERRATFYSFEGDLERPSHTLDLGAAAILPINAPSVER